MGVLCGAAISNPMAPGFEHHRLVRSIGVAVGAAVVLPFLAMRLSRPVDLIREVQQLTQATVKLQSANPSILRDDQAQHLQNDHVTDRLEREILPYWTAERLRLAKFRGLPARQQKVVDIYAIFLSGANGLQLRLSEPSVRTM